MNLSPSDLQILCSRQAGTKPLPFPVASRSSCQLHSRSRVRLTRTGVLFLLAMVGLYLASITSQSGLLLFLIGLLGGCFGVNAWMAWRCLGAMKLTAPSGALLAEREKLTQPWTLLNTGRSAAGLVRFEHPQGMLFQVGLIKPGESFHAVPEIVFARRGVYPVGTVSMSTAFPFGLVRWSRPLEQAGEWVICPAIYPVDAPRAGGYDSMVGGRHPGTRRTTFGSRFAGVRPRQPGDPLKQIHWKSSAKGLGLMVKTYDEDLSGRVALGVDCSEGTDSKRLDDCLRAAGSLAFAALDEGHHVEWIDLASRTVWLIPPFDDGQALLECLARMKGSPDCLTDASLQDALGRISGRSAVCLVLTECNAAVYHAIQILSQKNRSITLALPRGYPGIGLPEKVRIAGYTATELEWIT